MTQLDQYPMPDSSDAIVLEERGDGRYDLTERTAKFGEDVRFARAIPQNAVTTPLISQVVRSGTSIGANYCEADGAVSRKEFRQKLGFCRKEAKETKHWLYMLATAVPSNADTARRLWQEAKELHLIFCAIINKLEVP